MPDDARLAEAKRLDLLQVADRLDILKGLRPAGAERVGPCPVCGGRDRFGLNPGEGVYNCRQCGGGDSISLVQLVLGLDFRGALDWMVGATVAEVSPEEQARRAAAEAEAEAARQRESDRRRAAAVARARAIWKRGVPAEGTPVRAYLAARGLTPERLPRLPAALRFQPDLPYMVADDAGGWREIHRGPAMLAAIQGPDGRFAGVHRTWIDPDRPGKKISLHRDGVALPAKKVEGSKKGGAIRLIGPRPGAWATLIMGEGIETTLSAVVTGLPGAAYWAGVDLGNMAGRRLTTRMQARAAGLPEDGIRTAGFPDLSDAAAFVPPPGTRRLVFLQDGDSDPDLTRAKLLAGLRRARARVPGLERTEIVAAPRGCDLNDLLTEANV